MNKNPGVEVKLQQYRHDFDGDWPDDNGGWYLASGVDPLLESKEKRIRELEEGLENLNTSVWMLLNANNDAARVFALDAMRGLHEAARTLLSEEKPL